MNDINIVPQTEVAKAVNGREVQPSRAANGKGQARRDRRETRGRASRNADEAIQTLPMGWTAKIVEPDAEGTKDSRTRLRLMVLENPDKGFKLLPFMTIRVSKKMMVNNTAIETIDDMDILPHNILEVALPATLFGQGAVLESLLEMFDVYAKQQAALPPPSKRPLTQRPFAMKNLAKLVRASHEERRHPREEEPKNKRKRSRNKKKYRHDRAATLLLALL